MLDVMTDEQIEGQKSDGDLLQNVQAGSHDAFQELQATLDPPIRRFVRRLLGDRVEGRDTEDDIIQEVFISLYRNLDRIKPFSKVRPYTFGIARKRCYTELRKRPAPASLDSETGIDYEIIPIENATPLDEVTNL